MKTSIWMPLGVLIALPAATFAAENVATTGAPQVRPNSGVLSPLVSIAPGEAVTLATMRVMPLHLKVNNILRTTLPMAAKPAAPMQTEAAKSVTPQISALQPVTLPTTTIAETKVAETRIAEAPQRVTPSVLSSRHKERILLAQLEADLNRSESRLSRADAGLAESARQLSKFTNTLRAAMLEAGPDAKGLHPFVRAAQGYAGTPYVWGGESRNGFDCSGFIIRVMRDLGYRALPHSAAEQFTYGKPIAQALLKPGDLVFFANTYKPGISHVGIYLGRRRFIHAAGTGLGTIVSSLDASKFQAKYAGARRLVAGG